MSFIFGFIGGLIGSLAFRLLVYFFKRKPKEEPVNLEHLVESKVQTHFLELVKGFTSALRKNNSEDQNKIV